MEVSFGVHFLILTFINLNQKDYYLLKDLEKLIKKISTECNLKNSHI